MDFAKKVIEAFKPHNSKALILGGLVVLSHIALFALRKARRTNKLTLGLRNLNFRPYIAGRDQPWAVILYNQGNKEGLVRLCEGLAIDGVNLYVLTPPSNQEIIDKIQGDLSKTPCKFRYSFTAYTEYDDSRNWTDIAEEFNQIDVRLLIHLGDEGYMGWRCFEEFSSKTQEVSRVVAPQYVLALSLLALSKAKNDGRRAVVQIEGLEDSNANEAENGLLDGVGLELLEDGIEYKRVVNLQTFLNYQLL